MVLFCSSRNSQLKLLAGVVVKRSEKPKQGDITSGIKRKLSPDRSDETSKTEEPTTTQEATVENSQCELDKEKSTSTHTHLLSEMGGMKCIGILPGLGSYEDSSDSDCSSDTDQDPEPSHSKYDLLGRKIETVSLQYFAILEGGYRFNNSFLPRIITLSFQLHCRFYKSLLSLNTLQMESLPEKFTCA